MGLPQHDELSGPERSGAGHGASVAVCALEIFDALDGRQNFGRSRQPTAGQRDSVDPRVLVGPGHFSFLLGHPHTSSLLPTTTTTTRRSPVALLLLLLLLLLLVQAL